MKQITATVTSKGQVTIPAEARKHLGLNGCNKVTFIMEEDGSVHLRRTRYPDLASLRGAAGSLDRPLAWEEMLRIAREDHLADYDDTTT